MQIFDDESASGLFLASCLALQEFNYVAFENACKSTVVCAKPCERCRARNRAGLPRRSSLGRRCASGQRRNGRKPQLAAQLWARRHHDYSEGCRYR